MVKIIFFVFCLISAFNGSTTSTNIECNFNSNANYYVLGSIYRCSVKNYPNIITEESAEINLISGTHEDSKSNDDVLGIDAVFRTIKFFPKGLDKIFKNLKVIVISNCQLKEIRQSDLKVFPNLVYFALYRNGIEVIEKGLFDFNPNLEVVGFLLEFRIIHIDPNVFDHLTKLSHLWFHHVPCVDQIISNSTEKVQETIKIVKSKCSNLDFFSIKNQIENLEIESKTLNSSDFSTKVETFEKNFNNSKFSNSQTLNYKLQNLKSAISSIQNVSISDSNNLTKNDVDLKNSYPDCITNHENSAIIENDVNSGDSIGKSIILNIFLALVVHFLPSFW